MKTTFIYGIGMAIAGALINFTLYFLGYHDSVEKLGTAQIIGSVGGLILTIVGLILAVKARRSETPADEAFGYGRALGAGTLTALWAVLFGTILNAVYVGVINPGMQETIVEGEIAKLEAQGMSATQIEQAEGMIRMMTGPVMQSVFGFVFGFIISFVICLIIAAVLKRPATEELPPEMVN